MKHPAAAGIFKQGKLADPKVKRNFPLVVGEEVLHATLGDMAMCEPRRGVVARERASAESLRGDVFLDRVVAERNHGILLFEVVRVLGTGFGLDSNLLV